MNPLIPAPSASLRRPPLPLWRATVSVLALAPLVVLPRGYSLPTGPQVAAGQVAITQAGAQMTLDQTSHNAIVNWQSFSLGAGEQLRLNQGSASAALLARVTGNDPSKLLGSLQADGKLFLINPRGIVVGQGAVIDTAAFMASTLDVTDADFLKGAAMTFKGDSDAGIVNLGRITAREGNVMLFAHTVNNAGTISAPKGTAALGAGTEVYLGSPDDSSMVIKFNLPTAAGKTGVENSGVIAAAQAELKAAGGSIYDLAINQSGVIRATGVENKNGRILLTAEGGTVGVSGTATARNADGSGGEILVGGDAHGANPAVPNAAHTAVTANATLDAGAASANGAAGRVIVWSDQATRFLGRIDAQGAGGGFAEVSGRHDLEFAPASPVNLGANGTLLLDPDALVISSSADSGTSTSGTNPFTFGAVTTPATLNITTLQNQLASSNVILDTSTSSRDITFNAAVTWATANSLTAKAGGSININQSITGTNAASALVLNPGKAATPTSQGPLPLNPKATLASSAGITVGTLTYGTNGSAAPVGYITAGGASAADFEGNLNVGTLQVDLANGGTGIGAFGANNTIGTFKTTGTGDLTFANVANNNGALNVQLTSASASAPQVRVTTPGTLTLQAGSSLSFAAQTDVILASTGGSFINLAGASVFGGDARFLIYGSNASKGGLTGIDVFSHAYSSSDDFSSDTASRFLFSGASGLPFLTYTADDKSRTYGASNPTFTATVTGFTAAPNDVTGAAAFSATATRSSGVGSYTINVARGTLGSSNYDFLFAPGSLSITPASLTITANNASRTPNTANPGFGVSYSGFVNGENSSVVSGLSVGTTATLGSPVGTYAITPFNATAANYSISLQSGTLTITDTAPLTIGANSFSRTYGSNNPAFTASITGLIGTDTTSVVSGLQLITTATQLSGVGTYAITPLGATAPGYVISYVPGTLTIDRASLLISPQNAARFYGDANPTLTASFSGLTNGDTPSSISGVTLSTTATTASSTGVYPITVSGGSNPNYNISLGGSAQLTVNPAPLTVTFDDKSRSYGDANPALTYSISGLKNGDSAASAVSVSDVHTTAAVTDGIGAYGINGLVLPQSSNYNVTGVGGDLTVTQRPLTITADNKSKIYGDANPALTATFSGLAPFDTSSVIPNLKLSTTATLTSGVSDLGYGILVSSDLNQNYAINYKFGSLTITPATLSLLAPPDVARIYGRADPALPALNFGGLKNSDTIAGLGASYVNIPVPTADAGTYTYGVAIKTPNYKLSGATTGLFRVDPAPLDVQVGGAGRTYGDANPTSYSVNAQGLAFGQTTEQVLRVVNPTDQTTGVGIYDLTAQLLSKNYYFNSLTPGKLQINPRLLSFSIDNVARYYGDIDPDFTYTFGRDGLAPSDNVASIISGFKTAQPIGLTTNVGLYRIDPIFKNNPNYLVSWTPSYLAILPRPIELTINNAITFGNDNVPVGFSTAGTGVDLVHPPVTGGTGVYTGFTATATNLPANVSLHDVYPSMQFDFSATNDPRPVQVATDLSAVFPKTTATAPQATTAAIAPSAPASSALPTLVFSTTNVIAPVSTDIYAVIGGKVVKNPTAAEAVLERFADQTFFVYPITFENGNYAVTKITNGLLTMKSDPEVVRINVEIALQKDQRAKAQAEFANNGQNGAFGLPPELFPVLRELLGKMLNDALNAGDTGPGSLYYEINGSSSYIFTGDQAQEDKFLFWLADIHTNVLKQAQLMPGLLTYVMNVAGRDPSTWSDSDSKLVTFMTPYVQKAQEEFAKKLADEKAAWLKAQDSAAGAAGFMLGTTDEYTEVVTNAIVDVSKASTDKLSAAVTKMVNSADASLSTDPAYHDVTTTVLKYSVDTALSGAGLTAAVAATKQYFADTGGFEMDKIARDTGVTTTKQDVKNEITDLAKDDENLDSALKKLSPSTGEGGTGTSEGLRSDVAQEAKDTVAKVLQSDETKARLTEIYDDTYQRARASGLAEKEATEAANEAVNKQVRTIAQTTAKEVIQDAADKIASNADAIKAHIDSPEVQKLGQSAYEAEIENGLKKLGKNSFSELSDSQAADVIRIANEGRWDAMDKAGGDFAQKLLQQSGDKVANDVGVQLVKESAESGAKLTSEALSKGGSELASQGAEKLAGEIGAKVSSKVTSEAAEVGAKIVGKMAVDGAEIAVKAGTTAAKAATMFAELAGGPVGVIELAVQVAVQAGSSAAERAEQDSRLNTLINNGSKPVDLHAMATDQNGRAIMMMGLLQMFSVQDSGSVSVPNP